MDDSVDLPLGPFMREVVLSLRENEAIANALSDKDLCAIVANAFGVALRAAAA
jgi:hypothetical protein